MTLAEAAAILALQPNSVIASIQRGVLPAIELDGPAPWRRRLRLRRADVEAYAANRRTWTSKTPGWT